MKPIKFKESNKTLKSPENWHKKEPCRDLSIYSDNKQCISCWKLSFKEKLSVLFFGKIWLFILLKGTQPPVALTAKKTIFKK